MNILTWQQMTSEERREKVAKLADNGFSAGRIAQAIPGATRNSVMGYVQRFKIRLSRQSRSLSTLQERAASRKIQIERATAVKPKSETAAVFQPVRPAAPATSPDILALAPISRSAAFLPIDGVRPVLLENLGKLQCHWPVNGLEGIEPIFCGAPADDLYCNNHKRIAYMPRTRGAN
ncbi:hypothetical protein LJR221_001482 [Agrobacterium tumefaciens]